MKKICTKCKQEKPVGEFYTTAGGNARSWCKTCEFALHKQYKQARKEKYRQYHRDQYERNPEYFRQKAREGYAKYRKARLAQKKARRDEIKREIIAYYSNGMNCCACCGESTYNFLSLDHIKNDGASHRKEFGGRKSYSHDKFYKSLIDDGYPAGIQVLCMNCNWGKQRNGGICPHVSLESSTTIPKGSRAKRLEAHSPSQEGEDIVCSARQRAAVH